MTMSDRAPDTLRMAIELAEAGYLVFPCQPFEKVPATTHGFKDATNDLDQIVRWFDSPAGFNLAVATGPQPNGIDLFVIDVDAHKGGDVTWDALCLRHGTPLAPRHDTPNGGFHLFFNAEGANTAGRLGPGVDTRGAGGYVVAPPSQLHDADGVVISYRAVTSLLSKRPVLLPDWLVVALAAQPPVSRPTPNSVMTKFGPDGSPADLLRASWVWERELVADGWQAERFSGGDQHWVRPGKPIVGGKSATLHPSGAFVVWSSERPAGGLPTRGADGASFSPYDYVKAYRFGGDDRAAVAWIRGSLGPAESPRATSLAVGEAATPMVPTLGSEFWSRRAVLGEIRDAARSRLVSPDALLVAVLARWAAMVPPCYMLPAVVGTLGTFDFIGCIVASSGAGKSAAAGVAREFVRTSNELIMMDFPVGSGEGLVQSFFVPEVDPESNKPTGKQVVGRQALHFDIDEGMSLIGQAGRTGTVIIPTLCSAWSGQTLGQANADASRRRIIGGGSVRVACTINMQAANGWRLFEDDVKALGFPGRILFASSLDAAGTLEASWSGEIAFPNLPIYTMTKTVLTYDPSITTEVKERRLGSLNGSAPIDGIRSQHLLLQCKVAGLFALQEGRLHVSQDDWQVAACLIRLSSQSLDVLVEVRRQWQRDRSHSLGTALAEREIVAEDIKTRQHVARLAERVKVRSKGGVGRTALRKMICSATTKVHFEAALELAVANGWVTVSEGRVEAL